MGKALSIKDEATYELVAELASRTGVSMAQAVNEAVKERLEVLANQRVVQAKNWLAKVKSHGVDPDFMADRLAPALEEPES
jgi:hypothetical protein